MSPERETLLAQLSLASVPCLHMGLSNFINTFEWWGCFSEIGEWEKKATEVLKNVSALLNRICHQNLVSKRFQILYFSFPSKIYNEITSCEFLFHMLLVPLSFNISFSTDIQEKRNLLYFLKIYHCVLCLTELWRATAFFSKAEVDRYLVSQVPMPFTFFNGLEECG